MKRPVIRFIQAGELVRNWGGRQGVKINEHTGESFDKSMALSLLAHGTFWIYLTCLSEGLYLLPNCLKPKSESFLPPST